MHYLVKLAQLVCDTGIIVCVSWRGLAQHMKVKVGLPKVKLVWLTSKPQLLSRHLSIHPSSTCSPIHSPSYPAIQPSTNPSIHHSSTHLSTHPSTHLPIHLHIHPSIHATIHQEVWWYQLMNEHWVFQSHFWEPPVGLADEVEPRGPWHWQSLNRRKIFLDTEYEQLELVTVDG